MFALLSLSLASVFFRPYHGWQRAIDEKVVETLFPYYLWRAKQDGFHFDSISQEVSPAWSLCGGYFKITANGDGTSEFESKGNFVKTKGHAGGSLSKEQLEQLSGLILATDYFSIPEYRANGTICASDSHVTTTGVVANGKKHTIRNQCYINSDLEFFETKFFEIVDANQWFGSHQEQQKLAEACFSQFQ